MYGNDCCNVASFAPLHSLGEINLSNNKELQLQLEAMLQQIWNDKALPIGLINKQVTTAFAKQLWQAVTQGYGTIAQQFNKGALDYTTPDWQMLAHLQSNVYTFSAAKNYTQLRELTQALVGDDGKLRSYKQFKEAATKINDTHVNHWLKAEYNLAVAGGQMASHWVSFAEDDMLEFDAVMDARTTNTCAGYNGIRLPKSNPFWSRNYPPNHFGCRSTVAVVYGLKQTPEAQIPVIDIPPMFQTNLAQQKLVFPKGHSYYVDLPEDVKNGSYGLMRKQLTENAKSRLANKTVEVDGIGKVQFSTQSIKEIFNQPHNEYVLKNQLGTVANLLLQNATLIKSMADTKGKSVAFHYLKVKGLNDNFILVVRQMLDGRNLMYSIVDKLK